MCTKKGSQEPSDKKEDKNRRSHLLLPHTAHSMTQPQLPYLAPWEPVSYSILAVLTESHRGFNLFMGPDLDPVDTHKAELRFCP